MLNPQDRQAQIDSYKKDVADSKKNPHRYNMHEIKMSEEAIKEHEKSEWGKGT
jgi:hypothetical protein